MDGLGGGAAGGCPGQCARAVPRVLGAEWFAVCGGMLREGICGRVSLCEGLCAQGPVCVVCVVKPVCAGQGMGASASLGVLTCVCAVIPGTVALVWVPVLGCAPLCLVSVGSCVQ